MAGKTRPARKPEINTGDLVKQNDIQNLTFLIEKIDEAKRKNYSLFPDALNRESIIASLEEIRDYFLTLDSRHNFLYNEENPTEGSQ